MYKQIAKLIGNNEKTIYRWKKEKRQIIDLLEKYFTKQDLEEFLETDKINKFDKMNFLQNKVIEKNRIKYLKSFINSNPYGSLSRSHTTFINFYFNFLKELKFQEERDIRFNHFTYSGSFINYDFQYLLAQYLLSESLTMYQKNIDDSFKQYKIEYTDLAVVEQDTHEIGQLSKESARSDCRLDILAKYDDLHKHFEIFNGWDSYMLLFLKECLDSDFKILFNENDDIKLQNEALYHIEKWDKLFLL